MGNIIGSIHSCLAVKSYGSEADSVREFQEETVFEKQGVYDFLNRLYVIILGRNPDAEGMRAWYEQLVSQNAAGAQVVSGFLFSIEFNERGCSDEEFLQILYQALFDRSPDTSGYEQWLIQLQAGVSREAVCKGFINSEEFKNLCGRYGIRPGTIENNENSRQIVLIDQFVERMYVTALGRTSDSVGKEQWKAQLIQGSATGAQIVQGFIFSEECVNKNLSDEAYVDLLYRALFDRQADDEGKASWLDLLNRGMTRNFVCCGFINSQEFAALCERYEIIRGSAASGQIRDVNQALTLWVYDLYASALGRPCSVLEQENALNLLINRKISGNNFVKSIFLSAEYQARQCSNEDFLGCIYTFILQKDMSGEDFSGLIQRLAGGAGRDVILGECLRMPEFASRCQNLGIICEDAAIEIPDSNPLQVFNAWSSVSPQALNRIQSAVNDFSVAGYDVGFVMVDLHTGQGISYNSQKEFYSASTIKGPYVVCLNEMIPSSVSAWGNTMRQTIMVSSNEGYASLRATFGSALFRQWVSEAGCTSVDTSRNYPGLTPKELAQMWIKCYGFFTGGQENSQWCAQLFTNTLQSSIFNTLGGTYTTYSKAGWIGAGGYMTVQNDAGIVMKPDHPYVIVIMSGAYGRLDLLSNLVSALDSAHSELVM